LISLLFSNSLSHFIKWTSTKKESSILCVLDNDSQAFQDSSSGKSHQSIRIGFCPVNRKGRSFQRPSITKEVPLLDVLTMGLLNSSTQRGLVILLIQNASLLVIFVINGRSEQSRLLISTLTVSWSGSLRNIRLNKAKLHHFGHLFIVGKTKLWLLSYLIFFIYIFFLIIHLDCYI
jgi:hypothetical protein